MRWRCTVPERSVVSSKLLQKHVGQTAVQLPHREAAFGYLVPARVAEVAGEQLRQAGGVDTAAHVRRGPCEQGDPLGVVGPAGGPMRQVREYVPAPAGRGTGQVATIKLCQGQVKALVAPGPVPMATQKHVLAGRVHSTTTRKASWRRLW